MLAFPLLVATIGAPSALLVRSRDGSVALGFDGGTRSAADRTVDIGGTRRTTHGAVGVPSGGQADGGGSGFVPGWTTVGLTWAGSSGVFSGRQLVFFFSFLRAAAAVQCARFSTHSFSFKSSCCSGTCTCPSRVHGVCVI